MFSGCHQRITMSASRLYIHSTMKTEISQFKIQTLQKKRTSGQINQVQIQVFATGKQDINAHWMICCRQTHCCIILYQVDTRQVNTLPYNTISGTDSVKQNTLNQKKLLRTQTKKNIQFLKLK